MANEAPTTSSLPSAEQLAQSQAAAREAQNTLKTQNSVTSPAARYKGVSEPDAENALAKAFEEATGSRPDSEIPAAGAVTPAPGIPASPAVPVVKTAEELAAEAAAEANKAGGETLDDLLADAQKPASPPPAEKPEEPEAPPAKPADTAAYSEHNLAPNASQKSKDTFEALKKAAVAREKAAIERAEAAEARVQAAENAAKEAAAKVGVLTPELAQELKELREHRALYATETDPAFKEKYDKKQEAHYESIYVQLRRHLLPEDTISELKKMSKVDRDWNIDQYLGKLNEPGDRRPIETKLAQIATIEEEKEAELAATRAKAADVVKAQREAPKAQTQAKIDEISNLVRPNLKGMSWFDVKEIPENTPAELKKQLEASNKVAIEYRESLRSAILNDDAQTRATAALAVPLSLYYFRQMKLASARAEAAEAKLEKITKASSTSRLADRASPRTDVAPRLDLEADPRDTMDDLFKQAGGKL